MDARLLQTRCEFMIQLWGERATLHPASDRETTCTSVTTVPRDRESLKATGADPTGISISVPERAARWARTGDKRHRARGAGIREGGNGTFPRVTTERKLQPLVNQCKASSLRLATGAHRRRGAGPAGSSIRTLWLCAAYVTTTETQRRDQECFC